MKLTTILNFFLKACTCATH